MKQQYVSPKAEIVCFAPVEHLASVIEFGSLLDLITGSGKVDTVEPGSGDISIDLG